MHLSSRYYACVATRSRGSRDTRYRGAALLRGDARLVDERSRRLRKSLAARTHEVRARVPSSRIRTSSLLCRAYVPWRTKNRFVPAKRISIGSIGVRKKKKKVNWLEFRVNQAFLSSIILFKIARINRIYSLTFVSWSAALRAWSWPMLYVYIYIYIGYSMIRIRNCWSSLFLIF